MQCLQSPIQVLDYIQVMVPRFQVKFCEKEPAFEILQGCTPIFKFYSLLVDMIVHISKIEDQALFATWLGSDGKRATNY